MGSVTAVIENGGRFGVAE